MKFFLTQYIMEMIIEEHEIKIDVFNNLMFQWTETLNTPQVVDWNQLELSDIYIFNIENNILSINVYDYH